jgi:hypothetical protein
VRRALVLGAVLCTLASLALYLDACSRHGTETSTTVNVAKSGSKSVSPPTVRAEKRTELPPAQTRPDSLIVGILGVGAVLLIAGAFYDRLEEVVIAGTTLRLRRDEVATAAATIAARTDDPQNVKRALLTTIRRLGSHERSGRSLDAQDIREAAEDAISELEPDLADGVDVLETAAGLLISVDARAQAFEGATVRVKTTDHFLPPEDFGEAATIINKADEADLGRRLYAVDVETVQVLAALSFELPEPAGAPILITALATDSALPEIARRVTSLRLTQYLDAIARKLSRPEGSVIKLDASREQQIELGALQFRAAAPEDVADLPDGVYWRQLPG